MSCVRLYCLTHEAHGLVADLPVEDLCNLFHAGFVFERASREVHAETYPAVVTRHV